MSRPNWKKKRHKIIQILPNEIKFYNKQISNIETYVANVENCFTFFYPQKFVKMKVI